MFNVMIVTYSLSCLASKIGLHRLLEELYVLLLLNNIIVLASHGREVPVYRIPKLTSGSNMMRCVMDPGHRIAGGFFQAAMHNRF
jgi:hypothetical protein